MEGVAAVRTEPLDIQGDEWHVTQAAVATVNLFEVLGARPVLGRHFLPDDDRVAADEPVVLSEALWRRAFAGEPSVIGRRLRLSHISSPKTSFCVVVGVTPAVLTAASQEGIDLYLPERREAPSRVFWLGHTNLTTTSRYLNIHRRELHRMMQRFEASRNVPRGEVAQPLHDDDSRQLAVVSSIDTTPTSQGRVS